MKYLTFAAAAVAVVAMLLAAAPRPAVAAPVMQAQNIATGSQPARSAFDAKTGRLFVATQGDGRSQAGAGVSVIEPDGTVTQVALEAPPFELAISVSRRKVLLPSTVCNCTMVLDADTLQASRVDTGYAPGKVVVFESTGMAYVMSYGFMSGSIYTPAMDVIPGNHKGPLGSITAVNLETMQTQDYPVTAFGPTAIAADEKSARIYVIGTNWLRTYQIVPGYIQAFDTAAKAFTGPAMPLGRAPRVAEVAANGRQVYVAGNVDYARDGKQVGEGNDTVRAAVLVVDAATLGVVRTIDLPDSSDLAVKGAVFAGDAKLDRATDTLYVINSTSNNTLSVVKPATGQVRNVEMESPPYALGLDAKAGSVIVTMMKAGQAGVFSLAGERIDTVPIGPAAAPDSGIGPQSITIDAGSGAAYATNGNDGSVARLSLPAGASPALLNLTDLWFKPAEPGWGVYVEQQGTLMFAALFNQDASGNPTWLVMSNGSRQPDGSFQGDLFATRGPVAQAPANVVPVGSLRFEPAADGGATLTYVNAGATHTESLRRFRFAEAAATCGWSPAGAAKSAADKANFTSLWWNPEEPGWGLAVSHQGATTFATLFTYDALNRPSWTVMSNGVAKGASAFAGTLYRTFRQRVDDVGSMSLAFGDADNGVLTYKLDGVETSKRIVREKFSNLVSACTR